MHRHQASAYGNTHWDKIKIFVLKLRTVQNLHFLFKNLTLISRENCRFFGGEKIVKMLWFWTFVFLAVDNFDFTRKIYDFFGGEKIVKMLWFRTF